MSILGPGERTLDPKVCIFFSYHTKLLNRNVSLCLQTFLLSSLELHSPAVAVVSVGLRVVAVEIESEA